MTTAADCGPDGDVKRPPALLDLPQALGFLPTRQFWRDPENKRLAGPPIALFLPVVSVAIVLLSPAWWVVVLATVASLLLMLGFIGALPSTRRQATLSISAGTSRAARGQ
jgi:hypothetical protein